MILRRHGRRHTLTRRTPSVPPPLPLLLVFADPLSGEDDGERETVRDDELIPLGESSVISAESPFPLVTCVGIRTREEPGASESQGPDSILASLVAPDRSWLRYAAVAAAASLAVAAALLPIRWPWQAGPVAQVAAAGVQPGPVEPVTYVVPMTVVGEVPRTSEAVASGRRPVLGEE